jgi:adenylate cyclase
MADKGYTCNLTVILSVDLEGYSRLMGEDEDAAIKTLTSYEELMATLIYKHRGRVVDSPRDNPLTKLLNVGDAVGSSVGIQEEITIHFLITSPKA